MSSLATVMTVYQGSDGEATRALYSQLEAIGPFGVIAANLLRAQKNSERAKVYRGGNSHGSYKGQAYERKEWAMTQLVTALLTHGAACELTWGWGEDPKQEYHRHVLYIDLPTGQASFHTARRGLGPEYERPWDGIRGASPQRICAYAARVLDSGAIAA